MSLPTLKWGVLGTGFISTQFVEDICEKREDPEANHIVEAIGVSTKEKGENFANDYVKNQDHKPTIASYEEVIKNPNVDIIYVGLPHTSHHDVVLKSLEAGKHVLCEKPMTVNVKQAEEIFALAKKKNLFFMEAVWTRFFPIMKEIRHHLFEEKSIGDLTRIQVNFSIDMQLDKLGPESRLKNPKFGGGALLDIGSYPLTYWRYLLHPEIGETPQSPFKVKSFQTIKDGIDTQSSIIIQHEDGKQAILSCSFVTTSDMVFARIDGTKGSLYIGGEKRLPSEPTYYKIEYSDKATNKKGFEKTVSKGAKNGLIHEANAVAHDIQNGKLQNDLIPWEESLIVGRVLEQVRKENGLKFPGVLYE